MPIFEKERLSNRSQMKKIELTDVIDQIKYSSIKSKHSEKLIKEGYVSFIKPDNEFDGDMCYYIKPNKAVRDYMNNKGYGVVAGVEYLDTTRTISFHSRWESNSISMTTTPQIAGILDEKKLNKKLGELLYEGDCQVNKAYSKMYNYNPNYALKSINFSGKSLEKMKSFSRNIWLAAGFTLNDDDIIKKARNGELDMAFKDHKKMKFLNEKFEFEKPFYVPEKSARKNKNKI